MTQPRVPVGALPKFSQPASRTTDPPEPGSFPPPPALNLSPGPMPATPAPPSPPSEANPLPLRERVQRALANQKRDTSATPITTSGGTGSDKEPPAKLNEADAIAAMIGVLGLAVMAGGFLVKRRYGGTRTIRKPTARQEKAIAKPAASIMMRHAKIAKLAPDLFDALALVAAGGDYVNDGPLTQPRHEPGDMPQMED